MARSIKWTETAISDLKEVAEFIGKDSQYYAAAIVREAKAAGRFLNTYAERGRVVPESNDPDIREVFIRSYRLIYKITPSHVYVISFVHGARDLDSLWKRRSGPE